MRVALVNTEANRGGAAKMAGHLTRALTAQGIDACLYHAGDAAKEQGIRGLKRFGSRHTNALLARLGGSMTVWDMGLANELLRLTADADVLHVHNLHGYYLNYRELLMGWKDRPVVWTWHDQWGAVGRCGIPNPDCDRWLSGCGQCPLTWVYPAAWLDWSAEEYRFKSALYGELNNVTIVSPSRWLADRAVQRGFPADRVQVIPNPVPLEKLAPIPKAVARSALGIAPDGPLLLFIAADCDDPRKGYPDFEQLVLALKVPALVVGKPPSKRSSSELMHYTGVIKDFEKLNACYAAANLMVMTSLADNHPNVIIEAMACGTAVLAYDVGGIPDQMPEFWSGLVTMSDLQALVMRCEELINDLPGLEALSPALRQHAVEQWDPAIVARRYIEIYEQATESPSRQASN